MKSRRELLLGGAWLMAGSAMPSAFGKDDSDTARPKSSLGVAQTALGAYRRLHPKATTLEIVDYVHRLGAGGIQIDVSLDEDVNALRKRLDDYGMFFEGDIRLISKPDDDTSVFEQGLRRYKALHASCVRTVSFIGRRYETFNSLEDYKSWKANAAKVLDICVPIAERIGVSLALENHKDRVVDEEVEVLRNYSSEHLGALVDFGNNIAMCDDPVYVIHSLAPFVKSCHMKNMAVRNYPDGFLLSEVVFDDGFLDVVGMWTYLKSSNPALNPTHELITRDPLKIPVLTDKYWVTWPFRSGRYLADTIRLVDDNQSKKPLPVVSNLSLPERGRIEEQNNINCFEWGRTHLA